MTAWLKKYECTVDDFSHSLAVRGVVSTGKINQANFLFRCTLKTHIFSKSPISQILWQHRASAIVFILSLHVQPSSAGNWYRISRLMIQIIPRLGQHHFRNMSKPLSIITYNTLLRWVTFRSSPTRRCTKLRVEYAITFEVAQFRDAAVFYLMTGRQQVLLAAEE